MVNLYMRFSLQLQLPFAHLFCNSDHEKSRRCPCSLHTRVLFKIFLCVFLKKLLAGKAAPESIRIRKIRSGIGMGIRIRIRISIRIRIRIRIIIGIIINFIVLRS